MHTRDFPDLVKDSINPCQPEPAISLQFVNNGDKDFEIAASCRTA